MVIWNYILGSAIVLTPLLLALIVDFITTRQIAKEEREICQSLKDSHNV